jgi:hypothetical protein
MITPGYYPIRGGTERVVETLSVQLNRIGVSTDVLTFNMDRRWQPKRCTKQEDMRGIRVTKVGAFNVLQHLPYPFQKGFKTMFYFNLFPRGFLKYLRS